MPPITDQQLADYERDGYRVTTGAEPAAVLKGSAVRNLSLVRSDPHGEFIIGAFKHVDGRDAVLIVNHSYSHTAGPTVELAAPAGQVCGKLSISKGQTRRVANNSPELSGLRLSFGAGDGRLFLLETNR